MVEFSIIMSCLNNVDNTKETVKSIIDNAGDQDNYELIITNDGSTDGTREFLGTIECKNLYIINNTGNIGVPKSMNRMMKRAKGRYVLRVDNDIKLITEHFLNKMKLWFDKIPSLGAVACITDRCGGPGAGHTPDNVTSSIWFTNVISGYCLMMKAYILEEVEYIDENYPKMYGEDRDLVLKINQEHDTGLCFNVFCFHKARKTVDPNSEVGRQYVSKSNELIIEKWVE